MTAWTLVIKDLKPTPQNVLMRMHWSKRRKISLDWYFLMRLAARDLRITKPTGKRRVTITRYYTGSSKEQDPDNFVACCKEMILDRLKPSRPDVKGQNHAGLGVILDDDSKSVDVIYRQKRIPKGEEERTEITIEDEAEL